MKKYRRRYPQAFTAYWETVDLCGIMEYDDFKYEAYLAWLDGRKHPQPLRGSNHEKV